MEKINGKLENNVDTHAQPWVNSEQVNERIRKNQHCWWESISFRILRTIASGCFGIILGGEKEC